MAKLKIPKTNIDYVTFYSKKLKNDASFFKEQNKLINSQIKSSRSLFKNIFGKGNEFKKNARIYLKECGILV